jgi:hypothetical protein
LSEHTAPPSAHHGKPASSIAATTAVTGILETNVRASKASDIISVRDRAKFNAYQAKYQREIARPAKKLGLTIAQYRATKEK